MSQPGTQGQGQPQNVQAPLQRWRRHCPHDLQQRLAQDRSAGLTKRKDRFTHRAADFLFANASLAGKLCHRLEHFAGVEFPARPVTPTIIIPAFAKLKALVCLGGPQLLFVRLLPAAGDSQLSSCCDHTLDKDSPCGQPCRISSIMWALVASSRLRTQSSKFPGESSHVDSMRRTVSA